MLHKCERSKREVGYSQFAKLADIGIILLPSTMHRDTTSLTLATRQQQLSFPPPPPRPTPPPLGLTSPPCPLPTVPVDTLLFAGRLNILFANPTPPSPNESGGFYAGKEYLPPLREGGQEEGRGARAPSGTAPSEASDGTDDVAGGSMSSGTPSTNHHQRQQMSSSNNPNAAYQEDLRIFVEGRGISHASARPLSSSAHVNNAGSAALAAVAATSSSPGSGSATASHTIEAKHDPASSSSSLPRGVLDMAALKVPGHSTPTSATLTASSSDDGNSPLLARNSGGSGRIRVNIRQAPGTPESGGPASKVARTGTALSARGGGAGGGKADGTTGGGGETKR